MTDQNDDNPLTEIIAEDSPYTPDEIEYRADECDVQDLRDADIVKCGDTGEGRSTMIIRLFTKLETEANTDE